MNNKANISSPSIILIIFGILVLGWLILNNVYINYEVISLDSKDYTCNNNHIELKPNEVSQYMEIRPNAQIKCLQECRSGNKYLSSFKGEEVISCDINNNPICECKSSFYSYYILPLF